MRGMADNQGKMGKEIAGTGISRFVQSIAQSIHPPIISIRQVQQMHEENLNDFVCEQIQPIPSDHLTLSIATVIGHGKVTGCTLTKARKIATTISAATSAAELKNCGLTETQSALVSAAIRLGQELCSTPLRAGERFSNSREIFLRYRSRFYAARKEFFVALNLNSKNQLIREVLISVGSLSTSVVHPREVFANAVRDSSAALLFLHNHPSGDPAPSREDRECTTRLCQAGKILGIRVLDHIVLGFDDYYSFADAGMIQPE
jgi:DNA repair protein RadC